MSNSIFTSKPIDKQANLVTNQSGCSDTFLLDYPEQKKILGRRKQEISRSINELKKEMGCRNAVYNGKLPRIVMRHPRYKELLRLINEVNEIEKELFSLKEKNVQIGKKYETVFFSIFKKKFPNHYEIVKAEAIKQSREDVTK